MPKNPLFKRLTVDVDPETHDRFRYKALDYNLHLTDVLRQLIVAWLDDRITIQSNRPVTTSKDTSDNTS